MLFSISQASFSEASSHRATKGTGEAATFWPFQPFSKALGREEGTDKLNESLGISVRIHWNIGGGR
jgi:hypothetical protein